MKTPYFFRIKKAASLFLFLTAVPNPALADHNDELDELAMYFDETQMVEVATGTAKPITQVAENFTIITREQIEAAHAHTVGELIQRVSGAMVDYYNREPGQDNNFSMLGTRYNHTTLLLDGVRVNDASGGTPISDFIPVEIVERIEIIKGPASSTWGSSLGGVINIITRDTGNTVKPKGEAGITYGEAATSEYNLGLFGKFQAVSYFLHGGGLDSDGLELERYTDRENFYGKLKFQLTDSSSLSMVGGYTDLKRKELNNWNDVWGIAGYNLMRDSYYDTFWGNLSYDAVLTNSLGLHLALQRFKRDYDAIRLSTGTGVAGVKGTLGHGDRWNEKTTSLVTRLSYSHDNLAANLGAETSRSQMVQEELYGPYITSQGWGSPYDDAVTVYPTEYDERRGIYANATLHYNKLTISPGLRYDFHSRSGDFVSPSLGATYFLADHTLLRATVAHGFSAPYLAAFTAANNPDLKPEEITSYQAGIETHIIPYLQQVKLTFFNQNIEEAWYTNSTPWQNTGTIRLNGFDLEAKSKSYQGLSLTANFTYTEEDSMGDGSTDHNDDESYAANLIFDYLNPDLKLKAQMAGYYFWVNEVNRIELPENSHFIWDLSVSRDFSLPQTDGEVFIKGHNIFNSSQYADYQNPNPDRWVEAGIKLRF
ncbi:MAG: TonB-dependent receptor [Desulfobulbaceae bacterium]|nr:TonB-dependent receptor [Desulfobulbaceae bacterium]